MPEIKKTYKHVDVSMVQDAIDNIEEGFVWMYTPQEVKYWFEVTKNLRQLIWLKEEEEENARH